MHEHPATGAPLASVVLIVMLAMISTWYVSKRIIARNLDRRIELARQILSGEATPPYRYRILDPLLADAADRLLRPTGLDSKARHLVSYTGIVFVTFLGIYALLRRFLRRLFFTERAATIGLLLLQVVVPLSITGYSVEGDFINLLFYVLGLTLIFEHRYFLLPAVVAVAALNRDQIVFLLVFFAIYARSQGLTVRTIIWMGVCLFTFAGVFLGLRAVRGFAADPYPFGHAVAYNIQVHDLVCTTLPLWMAQAGGFVFLCVLAFSRSNSFLRWSLVSLIAYLVFFFLKGNLWEMAKFLPAYLIMIPMSLQLLSGEFVPDTRGRRVRASSGVAGPPGAA